MPVTPPSSSPEFSSISGDNDPTTPARSLKGTLSLDSDNVSEGYKQLTGMDLNPLFALRNADTGEMELDESWKLPEDPVEVTDPKHPKMKYLVSDQGAKDYLRSKVTVGCSMGAMEAVNLSKIEHSDNAKEGQKLLKKMDGIRPNLQRSEQTVRDLNARIDDLNGSFEEKMSSLVEEKMSSLAEVEEGELDRLKGELDSLKGEMNEAKGKYDQIGERGRRWEKVLSLARVEGGGNLIKLLVQNIIATMKALEEEEGKLDSLKGEMNEAKGKYDQTEEKGRFWEKEYVKNVGLAIRELAGCKDFDDSIIAHTFHQGAFAEVLAGATKFIQMSNDNDGINLKEPGFEEEGTAHFHMYIDNERNDDLICVVKKPLDVIDLFDEDQSILGKVDLVVEFNCTQGIVEYSVDEKLS